MAKMSTTPEIFDSYFVTAKMKNVETGKVENAYLFFDCKNDAHWSFTTGTNLKSYEKAKKEMERCTVQYGLSVGDRTIVWPDFENQIYDIESLGILSVNGKMNYEYLVENKEV